MSAAETPLDEQFSRCGDTLRADIWYPRLEGKAKYVEIDLIDVRATDGIRVHYDFDRNGWVIEQPEYDATCEEAQILGKPHQLETWREMAFLPSWQNEEAAAKAGSK